MLILAASTQRTIGLVIAITVAVAFAVYVLINVFATGRHEIGSEIELAPNRKPYFDDQELETKKLDLSLAFGVGTLAIIALVLPLYWLGEPGRQEGYLDLTGDQFASRGGEQYEALCVNCHGAGGVGGGAAFTVLDEQGRFVSSVNWTAPALNTVLYRFSEEEVLDVLNYGRPQSPMPAWGAPGGGPLTTQQLEELIAWMRTIQLSPEEMSAQVQQGLRDQILAQPREENRELFAAASETADEDASDEEKAAVEEDAAAAQEEIYGIYEEFIPGLGELLRASAELTASPDSTVEEIEANGAAVDALLDDYLADLYETDLEAYGGLVYNNPAGAGSYGCARCHTAGASWNADDVLAANPGLEGLIDHEVPGGGGFGPTLIGVEDQFQSAAEQEAFIDGGCSVNLQYGTNGVCDGGQMPGFGTSANDIDGALLTAEQIAAVVAYERGLSN